jgi:hypothetical protein
MSEIQTVLMGDVISSRDYKEAEMMYSLKDMVRSCNQSLHEQILSPYTYSVTTGDEFQGVASSLAGAVNAILFMEEHRLRHSIPFRVRYVVVQDEIGTPINPQIAYEMAGPALTRAHELLENKKRGVLRFRFRTGPSLPGVMLEHLFRAMDEVMNRWNIRDYPLIHIMINEKNNSRAAEMAKRDRSLIYRRRKHLLVILYTELREAITSYAGEHSK